MSDTTDNRPEGNDHSHNTESAAHGAIPTSPQQPDSSTPTVPAPHEGAATSTPRTDVPPMPTRSPAAAAAAWPAPVAGTHVPQQGAAQPAHPGYASAPSGATSPTGHAFGPAATSAHPTLTLPDSASSTKPRKKSSTPRIAALLVAAALVGGGAGLGGTYAGLSLWGGSNASSIAGPSTVTVNNPQDVNATAAVASKVVPSVVTISATGTNAGGTGSGVVLSSDGYVLTNTHVVTLDGQTGNAKISVTTSNGKVYGATVVGTDPTYDLAVIKLDNASGLTPIEWADSSKLNVGDTTVAVGAPLDLPNTVTTGIVSALNRSIQVASSAAPSDGSDQQQTEPGQESPFRFDFGQGQQSQSSNQTIKIAVIQTDAAINPGNSGGALVDDEGKLIGINVAIASAGGSSSGGQSGNIGVGFSIPSDVAKRISTEIIDNGAATHGLLGASVQDAASQQGATTTGAYVAEAVSGGAAQAAGLQKGDVITQFNGIPVTNSIDLTAQVRALAAGAKAEVTFLRNGQSKTAEVTLGSMPTN
ncbi:trypsin-like peptidase domain-containing protein [uncultured Microbacterium sp.]|uniref:S1C family serine protease n=1 Tax=uncultured Microbacterium sp. TaxID=191216 RepID=UPI0025DEE9DC|nr:trypsin-like peptidase domain-containing protein [uncultured Microbacterium sp.]